MRCARSASFTLAASLAAAGCGSPTPRAMEESPDSYHAVAEIPIGGAPTYWDYLSQDTVSRRLYVTHGTGVTVIDMDHDAILGEIDSLPGVHGLAVAHDLGLGFASDGRANEVAVVDLGTLKVVSRVPTGDNPDAILYDPDLHEVYAFNGRSHSATVIAARTGEVVATIPLPGKPEFAVYDPEMKWIYDNIEDRSEIVAIDPAAHEVVATWSIAPGESPSGLALDVAHRRLFSVCENGLMVMVDSRTGSVVDTVSIGDGPDAARFDPTTQLAFSSNGGDGTLTIAHEDSPTKLTLVQSLATAPSARTMTLDPTTHRIYLSAADFEEAHQDSTGPRRRRAMVPGSFRVLVFGSGPRPSDAPGA